jgi:predicted DsbA family dithiol-disulfide isomerase
MKVEIWSDVMCPFCYIGKRRFEDALSRFPQKDKIEVVWKSFQLNPDMVTDPSKNITEYLAESKGWSLEQTRQIQQNVVNMAKEVGLHYNFDKAVMANSFKAHRFIQFAKSKQKGDAAEEQLFKAYFIDGKNTDDQETLISLGVEIDLDAAEIKSVMESDAFTSEVKMDIYEAQQIGVRGVPYFVFDDKYAVSGAQPADTFLGALNQSFAEHKPTLSTDGLSCDVDGNCE